MAKEINLMSNQFFQTKLNHIKPASAFVAGSTIVLNDLLNTTSGIEGVLLITSDGFEICSVFEQDYETDKLSIIGSSICTLAETMTNIAQLNNCHSLVLDGTNGKIMLYKVENKNQPMIAVILTKEKVVMGTILHSIKKAKSHFMELDKKFNKTV